MSTLQVKNIPDDLRERLQRQARRCKTTIDDVLLTALEREAQRLEWNENLAASEPANFKTPPSEILAQERAQRDADF